MRSFANLIAERVFVDDNPLTHEQGTEDTAASSNVQQQIGAAAWRRPLARGREVSLRPPGSGRQPVPMLPPISTGWPAERRAAGRFVPGAKGASCPLAVKKQLVAPAIDHMGFDLAGNAQTSKCAKTRHAKCPRISRLASAQSMAARIAPR